MEYLFELTRCDGGSELVCDPGNPRRAPGAFGDKSVVEFPEYVAPAWTTLEGGNAGALERGSVRELALPTTGVGDLPLLLWSAAGTAAHDRLPLLVVHDGVEFARFSGMLDFLDRMVADAAVPPMRAALLHPTRRDAHYSADPSYARALARDALPRLTRLAPTPPGRRFRVTVGASLGALSLLHVHRMHPETFGALFLQSGSFFHHRHLRHELEFTHLSRIRSFMDRVHAHRETAAPIPVVITCGTVEMNYPSNRATALALRAQGYPVEFVRVRDAHNWIGWRDAWTPALVDLLRGVWGWGATRCGWTPGRSGRHGSSPTVTGDSRCCGSHPTAGARTTSRTTDCSLPSPGWWMRGE
jgi:enterochelin esterase family protein